jgi:hypothetical protein
MSPSSKILLSACLLIALAGCADDGQSQSIMRNDMSAVSQADLPIGGDNIRGIDGRSDISSSLMPLDIRPSGVSGISGNTTSAAGE